MQHIVEKQNTSTQINAEVYANKALEFHQRGDNYSAIKYATIAIDCDPSNDRFLHLLGIFYQHKNNQKQAEKYFKKAIALNNQNLIYYYNLGIVYKEMGNIEDSLKMQKAALTISNDNIPCLNEASLLYIKLSLFDEAEKTLQHAYDLDSQEITTCINLSHFHLQKKQIRESIDFANKAILINPNRPEPYLNIGSAFMSANFHEQGIEYLRLSLSKNPENASFTHQSILMNMLYVDTYTPEIIFNEHKNWAETHLIQKKATDVHSKSNIGINKVLNIGFISSDFRDHSISFFLTPLFENISSNEYQIYCYSSVKEADEITQNFQQLTNYWRDIKDDSATAIIKKIKQDKIDILIDLSGHSLGSALNVFSQKPAPIQMSYLGYPFSTGLKNIDYRITDSYADPVDNSDHLHTEKLCRVSPSFLCYKPGQEVPICKTLPVENNNYITFGSFNNFAKLSKSTIEIWSKILSRVSNSKIILKNIHTIPDLLKDHLLSMFEENGIDYRRVILHHSIKDKNEHMAYYNQVDICLDPFPYNGTTTTFEAMFMGVPVITLTGDTHYKRVGHSILSNLNLNELIADSPENYVKIASELASNISQLKIYRHSLRKTLLSSSLTDAKTFTKNFEKVLQNVWINYCED